MTLLSCTHVVWIASATQRIKIHSFPLQTNPCQHPIVILRDVTEADLQCILKFMYHGEVQIAEEHLKDFLKTAETLQVRGLVEGSATPVLADTETDASSEEKRLMLRRQRLMRRRTNNDSNDEEAVDPTEVQNVSFVILYYTEV